ncbi:MAG: fibronectin type III domain-containing protein, partial [Melioribacteraceae bacterium]|nr:fibronectin type III domain-containing protein [Melioribacteraceae bacterium]
MSLNYSKIYISLFLFTTILFYSCQQPVNEPAASDKYRLAWNDDPATTMTVIWDQLKGNDPKVYYGKEDFGRDYTEYPLTQEPTRKLLNNYGMNTYFSEIKDLEPDQNYYFVIKDEFEVSERFYFRTAPDKPKAFTFIGG